ncbi:hypothetical protein [Alistipes sp.]|uniref:hypothetical protein n=1 Tax=Alistipes sp. TaxID=1872444 RepID=UPI003AF06CB5
MKNNLLLPHAFQKIGWILLVPTLLVGLVVLLQGGDTSELVEKIGRVLAGGATSPAENVSRIVNGVVPWLNNVLIVGIIAGSLFVACSRERIEDEMIGRIRLNALLLALYVNFAIVILAALLVYDLDFIDVMVYNLFTLPLLFLAVFRGRLWRLRKEVRDEE